MRLCTYQDRRQHKQALSAFSAPSPLNQLTDLFSQPSHREPRDYQRVYQQYSLFPERRPYLAS